MVAGGWAVTRVSSIREGKLPPLPLCKGEEVAACIHIVFSEVKCMGRE